MAFISADIVAADPNLYAQNGKVFHVTEGEIGTTDAPDSPPPGGNQPPIDDFSGDTGGGDVGGEDTGDLPGEVDVQPGLDFALEQEKIALLKQANDIQLEIGKLNAETAIQAAEISAAAAEKVASINADLQRELQEGRITHEQFMQDKELAQRESEFARDLALRTIEADRDFEIDQKRLEL